MEGLRAQADAIDACGEPRGRFFGVDGFGIGFEGHFGAGSGPAFPGSRKQLRDRKPDRRGSRGAGRTGSRRRCGSIGARELRTDRFENAREIGGIEEAGRAAAEVNCVDVVRPKKRRDIHGFFRLDNTTNGLLDGVEMRGGFEAGGGVERTPIADFALDGAGVGRIGRARSDSGMKITVGALGLAEGHLDVDSEDFFRREKRRDFFDARKLLMSMAFALDNADHGLLNPPQPAAKAAWTLLLHESSSCRWLSSEDRPFAARLFYAEKTP